jgi:hypothetical protein
MKKLDGSGGLPEQPLETDNSQYRYFWRVRTHPSGMSHPNGRQFSYILY